jgi:hypothetical protein
VVHVAAERVAAGVASYETLVEKARTSGREAREAAILESHDRRRVIVLLHLDGHEAFRHLTAAWDDHHLFAEHHAIAESRSLELYRLAGVAGEAAIEPASSDAYAFEHVHLGADRARAIVAPVAAAPGFRGVVLLEADGGGASVIVYRFAHREEIETFRATSEAQRLLGPSGAPGETWHVASPVRTFA